MAGGQFEQHGAQPQKQPQFVPLFIDKAFTGIFTQRNVLHDPSDFWTKNYGGRPDALWKGSNIELTNRLTLQRRPGLSKFSNATWPTAPLRAFSFQLATGPIQVIVDTGSTGSLALTAAANASGGNTVYTGTISGGASNAYVGMLFLVAGFVTNPANNGTFKCTASTGTTLTLANQNGVAETNPATAISSGAVYVDNQDGTKTILFGKSPGAGQTYFSAVAGVLYMGDGVDVKKYTPLNTNGTVWGWGSAAPSAPPAVVITQVAVSTVAWQASTWFSTMGIIVDSNGNAQQLVSVNADPSNPNGTQFGTSGNGAPNWAGVAVGGTVLDGSVTWTNKGPIGFWFANTGYNGIVTGGTAADPATIFDPTSNGFYENSHSGTGLASGSTRPPFTGVQGDQHFDNFCNWVCYGNALTNTNMFKWIKNHVYANFFVNFNNNSVIIWPFAPPLANPGGAPAGARVSYLFTSGGGTSQATPYTPVWSTVAGNPTLDGQLEWVCLGSATWAMNTLYSAWTSPSNTAFNCVQDTSGNLHVCVQTGTSGGSAPWHVWQASHLYTAPTSIIDTNGYIQTVTTGGTSGSPSHPAWNTTVGGTTTDNTVTWTNQGPAYGFHTADGSAIWVCIGTSAGATWTANQIYYLPKAGFSAPSSSSPLGSAVIIDSNSNLQFVVDTGVSGTPTHPSWSATTGGLTVDNGITWVNNGASVTNSLTWSKGHVYAYSYKARSLTDFYSVNVSGTTNPPVPPGLTNPLPAPTGSETNLITTASPVFTITGGNTGGAVNTIYGNYSSDPQIDTIVIWRDADGGGSSNMFELTEIPNIPAKAGSGVYTVNGVKYDWLFNDTLPDTPTSTNPGLNVLIPAPINGSNNPPPTIFLPMVYNFQRIWGGAGQSAIFSGGPDVVTGNPNEAFNPTNNIPFLANVIRLVKMSQGLVTFLTNSIELIAGGPSTASFYPVTLAPGTGMLSYNALDQFAGEIYFFSADNRILVISPSLSMSNIGFPLGDQFANLPSSGVSDTTWNPANVYLSILQNGIDNCMMIADGSTGWYRLNPHQVPGGAQGPEPIWSPFATITGGCKMVQTVETSLGIKKLLIGATTGGKNILFRDLTVYTDNGTPYDANFTMGSIMVVHPGELGILAFIEMDMSGVDFAPTISYLLNELSGSFVTFTAEPQFDPPSLYGTTLTPATYSPNRYYFRGTNSLARCRHMQIKVDFGSTSNGDEIFNLTIFGRRIVEA